MCRSTTGMGAAGVFEALWAAWSKKPGCSDPVGLENPLARTGGFFDGVWNSGCVGRLPCAMLAKAWNTR